MVRDYLKKKDTVVMADSVVSAPLSIEYLDGGIGYIHLSTCVGTSLKEIQRMFYRHLEKLINCKGLIIDVRDNRGGTDQAWYLLAYCSMPGETFGNKGKWITRNTLLPIRCMVSLMKVYVNIMRERLWKRLFIRSIRMAYPIR